jgi:hypothetical protein
MEYHSSNIESRTLRYSGISTVWLRWFPRSQSPWDTKLFLVVWSHINFLPRSFPWHFIFHCHVSNPWCFVSEPLICYITKSQQETYFGKSKFSRLLSPPSNSAIISISQLSQPACGCACVTCDFGLWRGEERRGQSSSESTTFMAGRGRRTTLVAWENCFYGRPLHGEEFSEPSLLIYHQPWVPRWAASSSSVSFCSFHVLELILISGTYFVNVPVTCFCFGRCLVHPVRCYWAGLNPLVNLNATLCFRSEALWFWEWKSNTTYKVH